MAHRGYSRHVSDVPILKWLQVVGGSVPSSALPTLRGTNTEQCPNSCLEENGHTSLRPAGRMRPTTSAAIGDTALISWSAIRTDDAGGRRCLIT